MVFCIRICPIFLVFYQLFKFIIRGRFEIQILAIF